MWADACAALGRGRGVPCALTRKRRERRGWEGRQQGMHFNGSPKIDGHLESSVELLRNL